MKKAAVLSLTAFYLLLTTGMFVCAVHCAAESLRTTPAMQMAGMGKHCMNNTACDCCKKHGNFVIKENLKPGCTVECNQNAAVIPQIQIAGFYLNTQFDSNTSGKDGNAPPGKSGKALVIEFRSLLI